MSFPKRMASYILDDAVTLFGKYVYVFIIL